MTDDLHITPLVGIHYNVPAEEYHRWQALSSSWMSRLRNSPAHLLDLMEEGLDDSTAAQTFGTAVHCAVLEGDAFKGRYSVQPEDMNGATKAGRAFRTAAAEADQIVLSAKEGRHCAAVARRAKQNPRMVEWLARPHRVEISLCWQRDGYLCKARLDLMVPGINEFADLKTTMTASPEGFARQIARYHYHAQLAWYAEGLRALTGKEWNGFLVAAEKRRPFLVTIHRLTPGSVAHGAAIAECDELFALYKSCCESGKWPGYPDVNDIVLPEWAIETTVDVDEPFD